MRRFAYLIMAAAVLCGCASRDVVVDFDYTRLSPLMYEFTNYSHGANDYKWDFGDGTFAFGYDAMHAYAEPGTYTVTLIAEVDGIRTDKRQTIRVTKPAVYIAGYTLYDIPYEDRYYKVVFKDDALLPSAWDFQTTYSPMLEDADLPYTTYLTNARMLDNIDNHDYWTIQVIRTTNPSNTSGDVQCLKQKLTTKELRTYNPEYLLQTESGSTRIGIIMEYAY